MLGCNVDTGRLGDENKVTEGSSHRPSILPLNGVDGEWIGVEFCLLAYTLHSHVEALFSMRRRVGFFV